MNTRRILVGVGISLLVLGSASCWQEWYDDHGCYERVVGCDYWGCWYELICPDDRHRGPKGGPKGKGPKYPDAPCDDGGAGADSAPDAGGLTDGAAPSEDSGSPFADAAPDAPSCLDDSGCAAGFACVGGACQACPAGVCPCKSDDACSESERCDLESGACEPVPCGEFGTAEACLARADCKPVYSGLNCTKQDGGACVAGDSGCTCETYDFAVCVSDPG